MYSIAVIFDSETNPELFNLFGMQNGFAPEFQGKIYPAKAELNLTAQVEKLQTLIFEINIDILFFTHIIYVNTRKREKHEDCNSWRNPEKFCRGS